jgi:polyisoprenoid-binding protein YceI
MTMESGPSESSQAGDGASLGADPFAGKWVVDGEHTSVAFQSTSLWGLVKVRGHFAKVRGEGEMGPDGATVGSLVIDAASVDTGNKKRDTHLASADFFKAAEHPEITYDITQVTATGPDRTRLVGTLNVAGRARPLELDAEAKDRDGNGVTLVASTTIDRSEWGIDWKKMGMTKMATPLEISVHLVRATT